MESACLERQKVTSKVNRTGRPCVYCWGLHRLKSKPIAWVSLWIPVPLMFHINTKMFLESCLSTLQSCFFFKVSSDTIIGLGATLNFKLVKQKLFRASQSSVVHIEAVLTSNQSPVWPAKIFQRFIDTVVYKRCLSQSFIHQSTSCAKNHTKAVLCSDISIVSCRTTL